MTLPTARQMMTCGLACCVPHDSLERAARLMVERDCGAIPVVDDPRTCRPVGMITDRDIIIRILARGRNPLECRVSDAMSHDPVVVHENAPLHDCAREMGRRRVRRLIVVDDRGRAIGIVTDGDLARASHARQEMEHDVAAMVEEVSEPDHLPAHGVRSVVTTGESETLSRPDHPG